MPALRAPRVEMAQAALTEDMQPACHSEILDPQPQDSREVTPMNPVPFTLGIITK